MFFKMIGLLEKDIPYLKSFKRFKLFKKETYSVLTEKKLSFKAQLRRRVTGLSSIKRSVTEKKL